MGSCPSLTLGTNIPVLSWKSQHYFCSLQEESISEGEELLKGFV